MCKKTLLIILLSMLFNLSYAQEKPDEPLKSYYKGSILWVPFLSNISFNYERQISRFSSVGLSADLFIAWGEYHHSFYEPIYLSYRQYTTTNHWFRKNFWAEPFISYIHRHAYNSDLKRYRGEFDNAFGLGLAVGRKLFFKKNSIFFMDIGGGLSYNLNIATSRIECTRTYEFPVRAPRIIILFGFSHQKKSLKNE